ncbi:unnamed protein product [Rotaria magnacalcarata]|uniref:Uncharacterized protein n=1 Tax=Rotaria magnacalcarata TaxID=392030 RepID=A0A816VTT5_9BILA|nr:unnamed protein product [Rotaria magnacalcarata]CAF1542231.1 unnamed protein product [Rotaria magnacalcarata]CAF1916956.1 unnamed protein product [Rotaria magnacalcarata]CAF2127901.1 unnamed protein product [Rotaria magnacalcarata]CAF2134243.1 unnamed protein product [Rotaria magnacalcarata]
MNKTVENFALPATCTICQTSHGFSSGDRRAVIVMVVLTGVALILCYVAVLWYAIRTRFNRNVKSLIIPESAHENSVSDGDEDIKANTARVMEMSKQPAVFVVGDDHDRF